MGPGKGVSVGDTLGPFLVQSELGQGGMGVVYRAEHRATGTQVALKVLKHDLAETEVFQRRFVREARSAGRVQHPHLVRVIDVGEVDGHRYIALSYVPGCSLEARIAEGPLPLPELLTLVDQVASGLDALHQNGVVHRDVKPSNILLDEGGSALLTDFGLARAREDSLLTQLGQVLGTLDYLAPEVIRGTPATAASDIYAFGCVIFECVAGAPPFGSRGVFQVGLAHLREQPPDPCAGRPELPPAFSRAVLEALAKEPEQRPATATEYASRLRESTLQPATS